MSVRITSTCMSHSKARYSAQVRARRGVAMRSTAGSSARLVKSTVRSMAPVFLKSSMKYWASSKVMPIAANTTAKSSPVFTFAWRAICAASSAWGSPDMENTGSFWPRTRVLRPSIAETPVWMNSLG